MSSNSSLPIFSSSAPLLYSNPSSFSYFLLFILPTPLPRLPGWFYHSNGPPLPPSREGRKIPKALQKSILLLARWGRGRNSQAHLHMLLFHSTPCELTLSLESPFSIPSSWQLGRKRLCRNRRLQPSQALSASRGRQKPAVPTLSQRGLDLFRYPSGPSPRHTGC